LIDIIRWFKEKFGLKKSILLFYGFLIFTVVCLISAVSFAVTKEVIIFQTERSVTQTILGINKNIDYTLKNYEVLLNGFCVNNQIQTYMLREPQTNYDIYLALSDLRDVVLPVQGFYPNIHQTQFVNGDYSWSSNDYIILSPDEQKKLYNDVLEKNAYYTEWNFLKKSYSTNFTDDLFLISKQIKNFNKDQTLGIASIYFSTKEIISLVEQFDFDNMGSVFIVDTKQQVVYEKNNLNINLNDIYGKDSKLNEGKKNILNVNGEKILLINNSENVANLTLLVMMPMKYLAMPVNEIKIYVIIISVSAILLALLANLGFSNHITKDIKELVSKINNMFELNLGLQRSLDNQWNSKEYQKDEVAYLNVQFEAMAKRLNTLVKDVYQAQVKQRENELKALQAQINPHFLHNTLSSINWMAINIGATDISHAINALGKFYRLTLNKGKEIILIEDEIEQVKSYINIQKIRFQDGFNVIYDIDFNAYKYWTPKIIIQPFVENSIVHAFEKIDYTGEIRISVRECDKSIEFTICDNGIGFSEKEIGQNICIDNFSSGYGIANVDEKIKLQFGIEYGVTIQSDYYEGTKVKIEIPKIENPKTLKRG